MAAGGRTLDLALVRQDGTAFRWTSPVLADTPENAPLTLRYIERVLKFLFWQKGGSRVLIAGAPELVPALAAIYGAGGTREFDWNFIGKKIFGEPLSFAAVEAVDLPDECGDAMALGRHLGGCRIGFDLGGSDRKCAAVVDGEVVFSEEIVWDPYFQSDPAYHIEGVQDSLQRAAAHLPRVDAIGGSAAGVYVNNRVKAGSLFRGVRPDVFESRVKNLFFEIKKAWKDVPFEVVNDGEVTALAGSMSLGQNSILGIALGTSTAAGYVTPDGNITSWLDELAFVPIDYEPGAPVDEWSGDYGVGSQYFSQQAVGRLIPRAGIELPPGPEPGLPERLKIVQALRSRGDERATRIYQTIGVYLGYGVAHFASFYDLRHVLVLGRVTSGPGGDDIVNGARHVLDVEFPELAARIAFHVPDEHEKRHGQAIAAASLPSIS